MSLHHVRARLSSALFDGPKPRIIKPLSPSPALLVIVLRLRGSSLVRSFAGEAFRLECMSLAVRSHRTRFNRGYDEYAIRMQHSLS